MLHRIRKTDHSGEMHMIWENNRLLNILIIVLMASVMSLAASFLQPESAFGDEENFTFLDLQGIEYKLSDTRIDVADDGSLCYYEKQGPDEGNEYVYGFQAAEGDKLILKYDDDSTVTYAWTPGTSGEAGLFVNISNSDDTLIFGDNDECDIVWNTNEFDVENNLYWIPGREGMAVTITYSDFSTEIPVQIIIPEDAMVESIEYKLADTRTDVTADGSLRYYEKQGPDEGSEYVYGFQAAEGDKLILKYDDDSTVTYAWTPGTSEEPDLFVNINNAEDTLTFGNIEENDIVWRTNEFDDENNLYWKPGLEGMAVTISYFDITTIIPVVLVSNTPVPVVNAVVQPTSSGGFSVSSTSRDTGGSEITITTNYDADGNVTDIQETTITKDSNTTTETTVIKDKDGKTVRTITKISTKGSDGITTWTTEIKDAGGATVSSREGTSEEKIIDGATTTIIIETTKDAAGNVIGTTETTVTDNADKSRTTKVIRTSANGVRLESTETTVRKEKDGSTTTEIVTRDSNDNITGKTITNIIIESNRTRIETSYIDKDNQVTGQIIKTITTSANAREIEIISKDKDGSVSGTTIKKITISGSEVLTETAEYDAKSTLISTSQSKTTTTISDGKTIIETKETITGQPGTPKTEKTETRTEIITVDDATKAVTTTVNSDITSVTKDASGTEIITEQVSKEETTTIASDGETLLGSHSKIVTETTETDRSVTKTVEETKDADGQIEITEEVTTKSKDGSRTTDTSTTTYDQNGEIKVQSHGHSKVDKNNNGTANIVTVDENQAVQTIRTAAIKKGIQVEMLTFKPQAKAALSPHAETENEIALVKVKKNTRSITVPTTIDAANGVTYTVRMIANKAFQKNSARKITMGPIKNIGSYAFAGAKTRKIIINVSQLTSVGKKAFKKNKATVILKDAKGRKLSKAKKLIKAAGAKKVK